MEDITETRISRVKHGLENWRELVIRLDDVLGWKEDWYPVVTSSIISVFYFFVWYWDPTLITFLAFIGLFVAVADYIGPKIMNQIFGANNWDGAKEKKFDQACSDIVFAVEYAEARWKFCHEMRSRKPIVHFLSTIIFLFLLAYVGNRVNNFFLAYNLTVAIFMLPGLHRRGLLKRYGAQLTLKLADFVKGKDFAKKAE